jgi:hypothetical protein
MMNDPLTRAIAQVEKEIGTQIQAIAAGRSTAAMCLALNNIVQAQQFLLKKQKPEVVVKPVKVAVKKKAAVKKKKK